MAYNPNVPAPDNLVQDDIAAMRENFQHLDPLAQIVSELQTVSGLAEIVDELQTVSGLAPITDDLQAVSELAQSVDELQAVSELAPYVQALLDSRIVEMGSNANGEYVRWENGLQVCFVRMADVSVTTSTVTEQGLTIYRATVVWTLPAAFVNPPVVFHVARTSSVARLASSIMTESESTNSASLVFAMLSDTSLFPRLVALAIGRWN